MNNVQQGWQCPVCKRVYAPWVPACDKCGRDEAKAVTTPATITGNITIGKTWVDTDRKCEKCGGDMQVDVSTICTSLPPQQKYKCKLCGNIEYHEMEVRTFETHL